MKIRTMVLAAAATLGLGMGAFLMPRVSAQQPLWDVVHVTLPYTVTLGNKTLPAGDYTIQQLHSEGSTVLLFYNGSGMKFETSAMTIKALDTKTPEETSVVLHQVGDNYYFDKIWIQGKDYGYDFPLPNSVKDREKEMSSVSVPAQASTTATATEPTTPAQTSDATPPATNDNTTATPPTPEPAAATPPVTPPTPEPAIAPPPATPIPEPQVSSDVRQPAAATIPDNTEQSANREKRPATGDTDSPQSMPATSAGWVMMLLSGGTLSGAGMLLRRKR